MNLQFGDDKLCQYYNFVQGVLADPPTTESHQVQENYLLMTVSSFSRMMVYDTEQQQSGRFEGHNNSLRQRWAN